jgi:hypothetical protein
MAGKGQAPYGVGTGATGPMRSQQGGNRNPNRVTSVAGNRPTSQPNPTNPYSTPSAPMGNGGADINPASGMPPAGAAPGAPLQAGPGSGTGSPNSAPNNPQGHVNNGRRGL